MIVINKADNRRLLYDYLHELGQRLLAPIQRYYVNDYNDSY